jgi:hypothetical protein
LVYLRNGLLIVWFFNEKNYLNTYHWWSFIVSSKINQNVDRTIYRDQVDLFHDYPKLIEMKYAFDIDRNIYKTGGHFIFKESFLFPLLFFGTEYKAHVIYTFDAFNKVKKIM